MNNISKKEFWENHVDIWDRSGLSQVDYCTNHKIPLSTFGYWKRKFKKSDNSKPVFYPLTVSSDQSRLKKTTETGPWASSFI